MSKEASPSFQFFPKDFLADENVVLMSATERGVYITLLCFCWMEGSVPASPTSMARMCSLTNGVATKIWPTILRCFSEKEGRLYHKRLDAEREKQAAWRKKLAASGRKGGLSRDQASLKHARIRAPLESEGWKEQRADFMETAWLEFHDFYPAKGRSRQIDAKSIYIEKLIHLGAAASDKHAEIMRLMRERWLPSDKWAKGFVMREDEFIRQESWNETPEPRPDYFRRASRQAAVERDKQAFEDAYAEWLQSNPGKSRDDYVDSTLEQASRMTA